MSSENFKTNSTNRKFTQKKSNSNSNYSGSSTGALSSTQSKIKSQDYSSSKIPIPTKIPEKQKNSQEKFKKIQLENVEKAKKFTKPYESSSSENEDDELDQDEILSKIFQNYTGDQLQLSKTQIFLENFFQSGSAVCLICIENIRHSEPVWSCKSCYCFFHLNCLKRWANDSIALQKLRSTEEPSGYYNNQGDFIVKKIKPIRWCCPKCRTDYTLDEIPRHYVCFCEKEVNPPAHPWLIPHSCGEKCERHLKPECGHKCVLLCHPGPCPPCPQSITVSCFCGTSENKTIRCFQKNWQCNRKCGKFLSCGIHQCDKICHDKKSCPPCIKKSKRRCQCGTEIKEQNCSDSIWHCDKTCNKLLNCNLHKCNQICHKGDCSECPLSLPRTCPCGKLKIIAPCSEPIEPCGDTCLRKLACGRHYCQQRCHKGDCSLCLEFVQKQCRCGLYNKEFPCSKTFTCETKCKLMRECGKHTCSRKCCDGQCPLCDKVCGKMLSCKKHKCKSICHDGPCYPCDLKSLVKCRCGNTSIEVPCGREKKVRAPKCLNMCRIPSKCHHQNPHKCHMNDCPPCNEKCSLENNTTKCAHPCEAKCHSAVKVHLKNKPTNIWDIRPPVEYKNLPHPQCEVDIEVTCIGGHETSKWPCWNSKATSCQRICGRILKCGNHVCQKICHHVLNLNDQHEQEECVPCQEMCQFVRKNGCTHPCRKKCHLPPCDSCNAIYKIGCHCGLNQVIYKCNEYNNPELNSEQLEKQRETLLSCGDRCIKNYPCGHRCTAICHSGGCPYPEKCRKKVKIFCECKNLRSEINCEKYRNGQTEIICTQSCTVKKESETRLRLEQEEEQRKIEEIRNRIEIEQFEKKLTGKKKYRERKIVVSDDNSSNWKLKICLSIGFLITTTIGICIYYFMN